MLNEEEVTMISDKDLALLEYQIDLDEKLINFLFNRLEECGDDANEAHMEFMELLQEESQ